MRRAARVDNNQAAIVDALRSVGVFVEIIGKPLDLLICHRGEFALMECKCPNPDGGDHPLTKEQVEFIARCPGRIHVAHSAEEAVRLVLGAEAMA